MFRHRRAGASTAILVAGLATGVLGALVWRADVAVAQMIPSGPEPAAAPRAPTKGAKKGQPAAAEGQAAGEAKRDPAVALRALESGIKSYEIGKLEPAVQSLTHALAGGLPSAQMARALYYRGLAYRKQAKPAQAISDLTSAIWLKGGLADGERATAIENRAAAYREAGLGEPAPLAETPRTAAAPAAPAAGNAAPAAWKTATNAPGSGSGAAAVAQASPAPAASSSSGSTVGSFFGNLFGGGTAPAAAKPAAGPATTASTGAPAVATSSWGDATSVSSGKARQAAAPAAPPTSVAAVPPAAPTPVAAKAAAPAFKGKFRLQVAAVRSRAEAETLAQKLKQAHGSAIGGREPAIEESVIGAMGTFYRVRVGPYADANEPRQLCSRIKPDGFDCLVVTQ